MSFLMFYQDFPFLEVVKHELSWEPGNTCNPIFCTIKKKVFCFEMFSKAKSLFLVPLMYKHWFFQLWRMNFLSSTMVISFDKVISFDIQTGKWLWVLFLDEVRQILRSCAESLSCSPTLGVVDPLNFWAAAVSMAAVCLVEFISCWINELNFTCGAWKWQEEDAGVGDGVAGFVLYELCMADSSWDLVSGALHKAFKWHLLVYRMSDLYLILHKDLQPLLQHWL